MKHKLTHRVHFTERFAIVRITLFVLDVVLRSATNFSDKKKEVMLLQLIANAINHASNSPWLLG